MKLFLLALIILSTPLSALAGYWEEKVFQRPKGLQELFYMLDHTKTGHQLLLEARAKGVRLSKATLKIGAFSITENTLLRSFDLLSGKEWFEEKREITLSQKLTRADAILDLAHELTHFIHRPPLNPYVPGFTAETYIRQGIEGRGGELDAFSSECRLAVELKERDTTFPGHPICERFIAEGKFPREQVRQAFYRVGNRHSDLRELLEDKIPELSSQTVIFRSAHQGTSYPQSLMNDYLKTRQNVCANNARRLKLIQDTVSTLQRKPAAVSQEEVRIRNYQAMHCQAPQ